MNEFDFIRERLAPLARALPGARALTDDAATLTPPPGCELVVTADTVVGGVHFRLEDPLDLVAKKALRVNLSDLAAKGADPIGYVLCITWPRGLAPAEKDRFVAGLAEDQAQLGVDLLGGDTTAGPGPLVVSVTAFGSVPTGRFVPRSGARPGDAVFVTGTIGDAGLGLRALQGELGALDEATRSALAQCYLLPEPRIAAAPALRDAAYAAIDVSDGLVADAGHIAQTSRVRLILEAEALPLSDAAGRWLKGQADPTAARAALATFGDDYELLFTGPDRAGTAVAASGVRVTRIGRVEAGEGVALVDSRGSAIPIFKAGFTHL